MADKHPSSEMAIGDTTSSLLQATLTNGINCNVRVIVNNTNVSPPPSDDDDMMEEDEVIGGDGKLVCCSIYYISYVIVLICKVFWLSLLLCP